MPTSRISNTILDPIGSPVANAVVVAKLMPFASFRINTFTEVARQVQTTTNASGFWQLDLERQSNINPADTTWWEVTEYIPDAKGGSRTWNISVGASDQTLYASLITPAYSQPIIISTDQATYLTQQSADARYQALSAIGATPNVIEPDDAASAGVSTSAARADHEHGIVAATASGLTNLSANAEGVATSFARSDHTHAITWNPPACRLTNTASQNVATSTRTAITFNTETYDTDSMHSTSVNTDRITINTAGLYVVTAHLEFPANAGAGVRQTEIRLNGSDATLLAIQGTYPGAAGVIAAVSCTVKLAVADYLQCTAFQNCGATLAVGGTAQYQMQFAATWIGTGN